jgi:hypothetical protein
MLIEYASAHIQHMQKAMTQMNLQLHHVISDITGLTGMRRKARSQFCGTPLKRYVRGINVHHDHAARSV